MTYSSLAISSVFVALFIDVFAIKTRLILKKVFWTSYSIILPFQLITNWWLTSRDIVMYDSHAIIGIHIASAPVEDLFFGFSLILSVLVLWVRNGKDPHRKR